MESVLSLDDIAIEDYASAVAAQIQVSNGVANDAIVALETVVKDDPGNSEVHYVPGVAFKKLENSKELRANGGGCTSLPGPA